MRTRESGLALLLLLATSSAPAAPRTSAPQQTAQEQPAGSPETVPPNRRGESAVFNEVVDRIMARENQLVKTLRDYSPRIETYIQDFRFDPELGSVPVGDHYFLGRLDTQTGVNARSMLPRPRRGLRVLDNISAKFSRLYSPRYQPNAFAYTIFMDVGRFDRQRYQFDFVRREFLGEVRCLVFDVTHRPHAGTGLFEGRIWVEDHSIVRFSGTYTPHSHFAYYFHFDSWRGNMGPSLWLPVYAYSEESGLGSAIGRKLRFKSQTRLWGYNLRNANHQEELTRVLVDALTAVRDKTDASPASSPVASQREMESEAEKNVLDRLEKAGLLAPSGELDKVLETVVNNLKVTNHLLDNLPPVHCRVLMTYPLESLSVGNTIVLSRGLIDVLPDEASLAMMLAHEVGHIILGHTQNVLDTRYAFYDRLLIPDENLITSITFRRGEREEEAADRKAVEILKNSPYEDKLGNAGLFLRALAATAPYTPALLGSHLGNRLVQGRQVPRMAELMSGAPELQQTRIDQISALPLGARIRVDAWSDRVELMKPAPLALRSAREKKPFEVTPLFPHLTRLNSSDQSIGQRANSPQQAQ